MDSKLYPIRVLVTRTSEESDRYLEAFAETHKNVPVSFPHEEVEGINDCTFYRAVDTPALEIFVIHTDERFGKEVFDIYSLMEERKTGIIMYIDGSVLGVVRLSSFHNFPGITFRKQEDGLTFFKSQLIGNAAAEISVCMQQRLDYLVHEQVPASERERKPKQNKNNNRRQQRHDSGSESGSEEDRRPRQNKKKPQKKQNNKKPQGEKKSAPKKKQQGGKQSPAPTFVPQVVTTTAWHQLEADE